VSPFTLVAALCRPSNAALNGLDSIPVKVVSGEQDEPAVNLALPVLHQLAAMLDTLLSSGECDSIDLHRTPLGPDDRAKLEEVLGQGEVSALADCLGSTRIRETAISGVWWITHYDEQARALGEFIEVTMCPEMLQCSASDVRRGLGRLRERLSRPAQLSDPDAIANRLKAIGIQPRTLLRDISNPDQKPQRGNGDAV
jgi:hydrogenase-1 operon protein HyaF